MCSFHRERERVEELSGAKGLQSASPLPLKQQQQDRECLYKEQKIQTIIDLWNLKVGVCGLQVTAESLLYIIVCVVFLVFAEAFFWMVFSSVGPKAMYREVYGPL